MNYGAETKPAICVCEYARECLSSPILHKVMRTFTFIKEKMSMRIYAGLCILFFSRVVWFEAVIGWVHRFQIW